jgi:ACT domain-containing protein
MRLQEHKTVVLVGHIVHSDVKDTIEQIDSTGYAEVVDLAMTMPAINMKSSARIGINAAGKVEIKKAMQRLRAIAKKKDLLIIEPIETEAPQ